MFSNHVRPQLTREYPSDGPLDTTNRSAELWKGMTETERAPYVAFHDVEQLRFKHSVALHALEAPIREWENAPAPKPPTGINSNNGAFDLWSAQQQVRTKLRAEMLKESEQLEPPPIHPPTTMPQTDAATSCTVEGSTRTTPARLSLSAASGTTAAAPSTSVSTSTRGAHAGCAGQKQKLAPQQVRLASALNISNARSYKFEGHVV